MTRHFTFIRLIVPATVLAVAVAWQMPSYAATSSRPSVSGLLSGMGAATSRTQRAFVGFYDGHTVTYLSTDTSSKTQAASMHINYSVALSADQASPVIYFVDGGATINQVAVFGSEPGEYDYSPLRRVSTVTWKAAAKRRLLTSENQILDLAKRGKLTVTARDIVLNCPIVSIGGK